MTDAKPHISLIPSEPLPAGVAKPQLRPDEHIEVYGLGNMRAVISVREKERERVVRHHWSSVPDAELAAQLLVALQERHLTPEKKIHLLLSPVNTGLVSELRGAPIISETMVKPVDPDVSVPPDVKYRPLPAEEAASFFEYIGEHHAQSKRGHRPDLTEAQVREEVQQAIARLPPQWENTPRHEFVRVEDAISGDRIADIWLCLKEPAKESFCYYIEVVPEKRRKGYGRKALKVSETVAALSGGKSLGLNVFGKNEAGIRLHHGAGFRATEVSYLIEG